MGRASWRWGLAWVVLLGCGDGGGGGSPFDGHVGITDEGFGCNDASPSPVRYRISSLHIPTLVEASAGLPCGHDVDLAGDVCGVADYPGGVDNAFIQLLSQVFELAPGGETPIDLQDEIDASLACAADDTACTRLDLVVAIAAGTDCARVSVFDGDDTLLAGPALASLDRAGNLRMIVGRLSLRLPMRAEPADTSLPIPLQSVTISGTLAGDTLEGMVLGGFLVGDDVSGLAAPLASLLHGSVSVAEIEPLIDDLSDVEDLNQCTALSVGLTGAATRIP